jgi:hypothetical protein
MGEMALWAEESSRVHELSQLPTADLLGLFLTIRNKRIVGAGEKLRDAFASWDRDQLITAIRDVEDPR